MGPQTNPNGITLSNQTSLTLTADITSYGTYTCTATNANGFITAKGYILPSKISINSRTKSLV